MKRTNVERKLQNARTVGDLIAELQEFPEDAAVVFVCDYGDYTHTQQALPVHEVLPLQDGESIVDSGYSQSGLALRERDDDYDGPESNDDDDGDGNKVRVVILK